jgi:hypothetical protein
MRESPNADTRYPVDVQVEPNTTDRNRLTVAFRILLAIPQLILVGGPASPSVASSTAAETISVGSGTWPAGPPASWAWLRSCPLSSRGSPSSSPDGNPGDCGI